MLQAIDVQSVNHQAVIALAKDFGNCATPAERMILADSLARMTASWRTATAERRAIHNRPRAGSLSPAERAAMRQRKSQRSPRAAPKLAPKESLCAAAPSPRAAPAGGATEGEQGSGVPSLTGVPGTTAGGQGVAV